MLAQATILDQIEITRSGAIQLRFAQTITKDGEEISHKWHRTALAPGQDIDEQLAAVSLHLQKMGYPVPPAAVAARVKAIAAAAWPADAAATFRAAQRKGV